MLRHHFDVGTVAESYRNKFQLTHYVADAIVKRKFGIPLVTESLHDAETKRDEYAMQCFRMYMRMWGTELLSQPSAGPFSLCASPSLLVWED